MKGPPCGQIFLTLKHNKTPACSYAGPSNSHNNNISLQLCEARSSPQHIRTSLQLRAAKQQSQEQDKSAAPCDEIISTTHQNKPPSTCGQATITRTRQTCSAVQPDHLQNTSEQASNYVRPINSHKNKTSLQIRVARSSASRHKLYDNK
ncbi:hypothetical protein AVEN_107535-1 [Araneus ventricosus]|uniref:Uncharacterized protein n=1 Tax=Araneus ventricosus TaxID=182803 RepID=A0A4Y2I230_ARAVE|nr:hypothetical protein AVEN_107535-1 [Araneus ventricosus]